MLLNSHMTDNLKLFISQTLALLTDLLEMTCNLHYCLLAILYGYSQQGLPNGVDCIILMSHCIYKRWQKNFQR